MPDPEYYDVLVSIPRRADNDDEDDDDTEDDNEYGRRPHKLGEMCPI